MIRQLTAIVEGPGLVEYGKAGFEAAKAIPAAWLYHQTGERFLSCEVATPCNVAYADRKHPSE